MKQKTFKNDGLKKIICPNCGHYMGNSHMGEKNKRNIKCRKCKTVSIIFPPRKDTEGGLKIIRWGPNEGVYTADLTESEIENSM